MSNATQKPSHAKTKLAPKHWLLVLFSAVLATVTGVILLHLYAGESSLQFGTQRLTYEAMADTASREKGLSGRASLPVDHGMLFVFEQEGRHCFWMKGMQFDLDMVWLDAGGTVVTIRDRVGPSTYPAEFCPDKPAKFVLEVNAGVAAASGVKVGSRVFVP